MKNLFDQIVAPVSNEYCYYFYILAVLFFVSFVVSLLKLLIDAVKSFKSFKLVTLLVPLNAFIMYFINRLLYNMCIGSI